MSKKLARVQEWCSLAYSQQGYLTYVPSCMLNLRSDTVVTITQLGNLLGALLNWVRLQRDAAPEDQLIYSIVGWHALTLPQDPKALSASRKDMLAVLLAVGLDPKRSVIFHQDEVRCASRASSGGY